jgi:hypothetical protein
MRELACNYSTIRFLPYRETGEFVNVGVVVSCPEIGFFDFKLAPKRLRRVKGFFPELDQGILHAAIGTMTDNLRSHRNNGALLTEGRDLDEKSVAKGIEEFRWLLRRRETLLHFADPGAILTADPRQTLTELYERFVNREFAKEPEYQETIMKRRLATWLRDWKLNETYRKNCLVGNDRFHTRMPFVHRENKKAIKALKPLDLNRRETTEIYDHGDAWVQRMWRLQNNGCMPDKVVFTVGLPQQSPQKEAAQEICTALVKAHVIVVPFDQPQQIRDELVTL